MVYLVLKVEENITVDTCNTETVTLCRRYTTLENRRYDLIQELKFRQTLTVQLNTKHVDLYDVTLSRGMLNFSLSASLVARC